MKVEPSLLEKKNETSFKTAVSATGNRKLLRGLWPNEPHISPPCTAVCGIPICRISFTVTGAPQNLVAASRVWAPPYAGSIHRRAAIVAAPNGRHRSTKTPPVPHRPHHPLTHAAFHPNLLFQFRRPPRCRGRGHSSPWWSLQGPFPPEVSSPSQGRSLAPDRGSGGRYLARTNLCFVAKLTG